MSPTPCDDPVLVADIGGTNTRVALADGANLRPDSIRRFANTDFPDLDAVLTRYLSDYDQPDVSSVCVAAAGPVQDRVARLTNLDWTITEPALKLATGAKRTAILNDLEAQGHALGRIAPEDLRTALPGPQKSGGSLLVVGLGTGMNAAAVHLTPWGRVVAASECGHSAMPVSCDEDLRLARYVATKAPFSHGFAGVEDVLAGRGLEAIHAFVCHEAGETSDLTAAAILTAIAAGDPLANKAARLYIRILGQVLGNLALIHLPLGGIYLIGGMARTMRPHFDRMDLAAAFRNKGRFSDFMANFAIIVVEDDYAALTGCAAYLAATPT